MQVFFRVMNSDCDVVLSWQCVSLSLVGFWVSAAQRAECDCAVRLLRGWVQDSRLSVWQLRSLPALSPHRCVQRSAWLPATGATQHSYWASSRRYYCALSFSNARVSNWCPLAVFFLLSSLTFANTHKLSIAQLCSQHCSVYLGVECLLRFGEQQLSSPRWNGKHSH